MRATFWRNQGHHRKITGIIKIIFDFTSTYVCTVPPRSHLTQTPLKPHFFHVKVVAGPPAPSPTSTQHPTSPNHNHRQTSTNFDDHGIRVRRHLAPQRWSSLTIACQSLKEYITADPQRELDVEVRR
jgi:hypothetical protein